MEPAVITHLRGRLAEGRGATVVGRGVTRAFGVRGEKVAENPDGTSVYVFTPEQVKRIVEHFDTIMAEEE